MCGFTTQVTDEWGSLVTPGQTTRHPATSYTARPKATPGQRLDPHNRVRSDRIGIGIGIGIGRTHARTRETSTPPPANFSAS